MSAYGKFEQHPKYMRYSRQLMFERIMELESAAPVPAPAAPPALAAPPAYPDLSNEVGALKVENEGLKAELAAVRTRLDAELKTSDRLRAENASLNEEAASKSDLVPTLQERVRTLERENAASKRMLEVKEASLKDVTGENSRMVEEVATLTGENTRLEREATSLRTVNAQLKKNAQESLNSTNEKDQRRLDTIARLEARARKAEDDLREKERDMERLNEQLSLAQAARHGATQNEIRDKDERIKRLEGEKNRAESDLKQALECKDRNDQRAAKLEQAGSQQHALILKLKEELKLRSEKGLELFKRLKVEEGWNSVRSNLVSQIWIDINKVIAREQGTELFINNTLALIMESQDEKVFSVDESSADFKLAEKFFSSDVA